MGSVHTTPLAVVGCDFRIAPSRARSSLAMTPEATEALARMVSRASRGIRPRSHCTSQTASSTSSQRRYLPSSDQISAISGRE